MDSVGDARDVHQGDAAEGDGVRRENLGSKYVRTDSGVMRNWRFQPTARSAAIRAPPEIVAIIAP